MSTRIMKSHRSNLGRLSATMIKLWSPQWLKHHTTQRAVQEALRLRQNALLKNQGRSWREEHLTEEDSQLRESWSLCDVDILQCSWHTACRRPCAKLPIPGFGGWGGVGWGMMLTFLELTHMVDATQHDGVRWDDVNVPWTYPHGWCYATWWGGVGNVPWTYPHGWCYATWWGGVGSKCQNASSFRVHKKRTFVIEHNRMALTKREYQWTCAETSRAAAWTPKTNRNTDSKFSKIQTMYWKHHGRLHTVYLVTVSDRYSSRYAETMYSRLLYRLQKRHVCI